jgi:putative ABC transport system permease protein
VNLAWKDIKFNYVRFMLTAVGVGAMVAATIGIVGLYRGIVHEALLMILEGGADLWVVQGNTYGPFSEMSRVSGTLDRRVEGVPGVKKARRFIQYSRQFYFNGRRFGMSVTGLDYPHDTGNWLPLVAGRHLGTGHFEAIADVVTGLVLGDQIRLGPDDFTIVGITRGQVDVAGDGLLYVSIADALTIDRHAPSEAVLLGRIARSRPDLAPPGRPVSAILITTGDGTDIASVRNIIEKWGDVRVFSQAEQIDIMLNGRLYKLRLQILAFVITMLAVTAGVVSVAVYASVLEKTHSLAMLKLMGASNKTIGWMIVQNAILIGIFGYVMGVSIAHVIYPHFPRNVVMKWDDIGNLFIAAIAVCACSSCLGVAKALRVKPQEILA